MRLETKVNLSWYMSIRLAVPPFLLREGGSLLTFYFYHYLFWQTHRNLKLGVNNMRIAKRLLCSFLGLLPLLFPLTAYGQGIEQTTPAFNSQTTGNSPVSLNPVNTVDQGSYVIINNESTNSNSSEYSGTFLPVNIKINLNNS